MQVEPQNYYSSATATIMQPHSCRYPTTTNKAVYSDVKDELSLPPLQTFHYDRQHYANQPMPEPCPSYYGGHPSAPPQGPSYQEHHQPAPAYHQQHHHYDPYPHASYHQPYSEQQQHPGHGRSVNKHLDPALLEEALNECMPFIEPIMSMTASTYHDQSHNHTNGVPSRQGTRFETEASANSTYSHQHLHQSSHHMPTQGQYSQYSTSAHQVEGGSQPHATSLHHHISSSLSHYPPSDGSVVSMAHSPSNDSKGSGGAARLCRVPDCNKGIRSRGLCKGHGGGRRCQTAGCKISDQGGGHCIAHGGGRRCSVKDCTRSAQARGLCKCHGGGRPCKYAGCTKNSQRSGYCMAHGKLMSVTNSCGDSTDEGRARRHATSSTTL